MTLTFTFDIPVLYSYFLLFLQGYFESLQWDESIAGCAVLEGLTLHPGTTETIFSLGAIRYLGKCLRVAKVEFTSYD